MGIVGKMSESTLKTKYIVEYKSIIIMKKNKNLGPRYRNIINKSLLVILSCCSLSLYAQKDNKDCAELFKAGEYSEAAKCYTSAIDANPQNVYALWCRSYCYWYLNQNSYALKDISSAIKFHDKKWKDIPKDELLLFRAKIYSYIENYDEALNDYAAAQKISPENTDIYFDRANLYYTLKKYDASDNDWRNVLKIDKGNDAAVVGLARNNIGRREYDKAIAELDKLEKKNNQYEQIYKYRGQAYAGKGDYRKAIDDAISYIYYDDWETDGSTWYFLDYAEKNFPYALAKISERIAKAAAGDKIPSLALRATLYKNQERYAEALTDYNTIANLLSEPNPGLFRDRGQCYFELGEYDKAIVDFDEGLKLKETVALLQSKARTEVYKGDFEAAITDYSNAITLQPMYYYLYEHRGWAKERARDLQGALEDYSTAVEIEPEYAYGFYTRGRLYELALNQPLQAKQDFEAVLALTDTLDIKYCSEKIFALVLLSRTEEAIAWQDSLLIKSQTSGVYYNAACAYSLMNKPAEAINYLRIAFEKGYKSFTYLETDADLDNIREIPEYIKLVEEWKNKANQTRTETSQSLLEQTTQQYVVKSKELRSGVYEIQCTVNDLPLKFIFDTGASDITISSLDAAFMLKNNHLSEYDFKDRKHYRTASGDLVEGTKIRLRKIKIGDLELNNIEASVVHNQNAPLLFGQSALGKFVKITIDNKNNEITFEK